MIKGGVFMVLELKNISKYYGDRKILEIEDLKVYENEKIGIVGQNGSGKTTLLNIIAGRIEPDTGEIIRKQNIIYMEQFEEINYENKSLSGGEKKKEAFHQKVLHQNGILLLDEPSSNLDRNGITHIEKELKKYQGTILIISHDRSLLDEICSAIIEIKDGKVKRYDGNYSKYKLQKEAETKRKELEYIQYINEKQRLEKAIHVSKNTAKEIRKTPKRMGNSEARLHKRGVENIREKLEGHTNALQTRLEKLEVKEKPQNNQKIYMKYQTEENTKNKIAIHIENLNIQLGEKQLFEHANCVIKTNRKTALIGENGAGKTTLINQIINGNFHIRVNPNIKIGYFSQDFSNLDFSKNVLQNVMQDTKQSEMIVKNILANLLFKDKDLEKNIKDLSGGERVKVSIAKILVSDNHLLILDEPTNFLDIESIESLEKLLKEYNGTILFVTHDKTFIDHIATDILVIKNHKIIEYEGNYSSYLQYEKERSKKQQRKNENDKLLLDFKISQITTELAMTKDEQRKKELEEEFNELIKLKHLTK